MLTKDDIRAAGGIVHGDGNVFFTNIDQLNAALLEKLRGGVELPEPDVRIYRGFATHSTKQLLRYGDARVLAAREQAIEECAKVCLNVNLPADDRYIAGICSAAIRDL